MLFTIPKAITIGDPKEDITLQIEQELTEAIILWRIGKKKLKEGKVLVAGSKEIINRHYFKSGISKMQFNDTVITKVAIKKHPVKARMQAGYTFTKITELEDK